MIPCGGSTEPSSPELDQDYVRTARAKGHASIPILTVLGPELATLITGSFIIETVFSVPGIRRLFVQGSSSVTTA